MADLPRGSEFGAIHFHASRAAIGTALLPRWRGLPSTLEWHTRVVCSSGVNLELIS